MLAREGGSFGAVQSDNVWGGPVNAAGSGRGEMAPRHNPGPPIEGSEVAPRGPGIVALGLGFRLSPPQIYPGPAKGMTGCRC